MEWKLVGRDAKIVLAVIGLGYLIIGASTEGKAENKTPSSKKSDAWVCVHVVTEVVVAGSPALELIVKQPDDLIGDRQPCSTMAAGRPESGCYMTAKVLVHDGDDLTVEINRLFATDTSEGRNMFRATYPIVAGKGTGAENEGFTDPNGQGHGRVHIAVGEPNTCKPGPKSTRTRRR